MVQPNGGAVRRGFIQSSSSLSYDGKAEANSAGKDIPDAIPTKSVKACFQLTICKVSGISVI
jgi:hypothetical protein